MVTAAVGGEFEVPTIDGGKTRVKVPEGTQSGRRFRLQGKGMPVLRARQSGDMYVQVVVETPQNLTKKQRELLAEFDRLSSTADATGILGLLRQGQGVPRRPGRPRDFRLKLRLVFTPTNVLKAARLCLCGIRCLCRPCINSNRGSSGSFAFWKPKSI